MEENYKDIFKKHFENHEDDIDPQIIWDNIRPKKDRKILWFGLGLLFAIFVSSFVYLSVVKDIEHRPTIQSSELENHSMAKQAVQAKENTDSNKNIVDTNNELNNQKDPSNKISETSTSKNSNLLNTRNIKSAVPTKAVPTFTEVEKPLAKGLNQNGFVTERSSISSLSNQKVLTELDARQNKIAETKVALKKIEKADVDKPIAQKESNVVFGNINALELLSIYEGQISFVERVKKELTLLPRAKQSDPERIKVKPSNQMFSLGLNAAYGFLNSDRVAISENYSEQLDRRNDNLENLEAARINLLLNYHLGSKVSLSSGLQYTRLNELFTWEGSYRTTKDGEYIMDLTETSEGVITTFAQGEYEATETRNMRIYNKTNLISIPVILSLNQPIGKFDISIGGGIEANVAQWRDGFVLNEQGVPLELRDQETSNFGLSYVGNLGLGYTFNEKLKLSANIGYVQFKHSEVNLNTDYKIANVGIGLKYLLSH